MSRTTVHRLMYSLLLALFATAAWATEPFMPRYPAISPDGETIVFSFQGDLWRVTAEGGEAVRLTVHPAYDSHPVFSPDGSRLAFASDRYDDVDIFVLPMNGGAPERLTYAANTDLPFAFSEDGETLYFASRRLFDYPMGNQIQQIPVDGGTPFRVADMFGDDVAVGPNQLVIAEGRLKFGRIKYRGTYQRDIYGLTPGGDPVQLTDHNGLDTRPMAAPDGTIYYVSDDNDQAVANIWRMNSDGSGKSQVTRWRENGVRWANLSADGSRMVIERGTMLYTMDLPAGQPRELTMNVAADLIENPVRVKTFTGSASEIAVSPDGKEFALIVNGDIVLVNKELGGRAVVPVPDPAREEAIAFRPGEGADTLAFVTDRYGDKTLCLLVSDDPDESNLRLAKAHKIVKLTDGDRPAKDPQWSPSGDRIAYVYGNADMHIMDHDGDNDRTLTEHWSEPSFAWSPDGNWIAYSREDRNFNTDVWIMPAEGGDAVNISQHPDDDFGPVWSENGHMIGWSTRRHGNQYDAYFAYLTKELDERTKEEWEIWEKTRDDVPAKKDDEDSDDDEDEEEEEPEFRVEIDFADIHLRARRLTSGSDGEFLVAIHPKGDNLFYETDDAVISVNRFGDDEETVISSEPTDLMMLDETFYFVTRGQPSYVGIGGGSVESTDINARLTIDKTALRLQVMDEGWRMMRDWFYDPGMHGTDWPAIYMKYSQWVEQVAHDDDFADVLNLMLGELNASHMGYYPDSEQTGGGPADGYIGVEFDRTWRGDGLQVAWVLPDGPADETDVGLMAGDIVTEVNGMEVGRAANLYAALEDQGDMPTSITWTRDGDEMSAMIIPTNYWSIRGKVYTHMEKANRARVEEQSDGRVGYVHIQGMSMPEVERFEMNLYAAADDKDALIIDVRNNGGGWTTDMMMTILTQPVHAFTIGRNGEVGYPQPRYPLYRWEKPVAVICNAGSYSNAEIFSHAIKTTDRGPLVGEETGGNVISTGGWSTMDGGWIRMPFRGWYVWGDETDPARNNKNQEAPGEDWGGAVPDYPVPFTHADRIADRDPQLDRAIELMIQAARDEAAKPRPMDDPNRLNYDGP